MNKPNEKQPCPAPDRARGTEAADAYEEVVAQWFEALRPAVMGALLCRYAGLTLADAEDAYTDAFLAAQRNLVEGRVGDDTAWPAYITRIALNLAARRCRVVGVTDSYDPACCEADDADDVPAPAARTARRVEQLLAELPDQAEADFYNTPQVQKELNLQIAALPRVCAVILRLFYYYGTALSEIARRAGLKNADTAKARKLQCLRTLTTRLRSALARAGIECPSPTTPTKKHTPNG